ncbi:MAG: CBS domain-containing protein [Deltaproteobacteria bacterium]|nr:CBS domain-containing protein [Deltaproteobacteria bacterium]
MKLSNSDKLAREPESLQENLLRSQARHLESMREDLLRGERKALLEKCRRIAVVGASADPDSSSYLSIEKFLGLGLEVVPILPGYQDFLGIVCYDHLRDVPGDVDIVQVYSRAAMDLAALAHEAVEKGAKLLWLEEGHAGPEIKKILAASGVPLVEGESLEKEYIKHFLFVFAERRLSGTERRPVKVRDFMTVHPVTVKPSDAIKEALDKIEKGKFRHLPVVDGDGNLVGIISDRDIRLIHPSPLFVRPDHAPAQLLMIKVRQAAVLNPVVIGPDASLEEATKLILHWEVGALPVVDEGNVLVGIITYADLLREFLAREKREWGKRSR